MIQSIPLPDALPTSSLSYFICCLISLFPPLWLAAWSAGLPPPPPPPPDHPSEERTFLKPGSDPRPAASSPRAQLFSPEKEPPFTHQVIAHLQLGPGGQVTWPKSRVRVRAFQNEFGRAGRRRRRASQSVGGGGGWYVEEPILSSSPHSFLAPQSTVAFTLSLRRRARIAQLRKSSHPLWREDDGQFDTDLSLFGTKVCFLTL